MIGVRWRKVGRDLWGNRGRSLLIVLAVALSLFALGGVLGAYAVLGRETTQGYLGTEPAHVTLVLRGGVDDALVQAAEQLPEVESAQARGTVLARAQVGPSEWRTLALFVVPDFNNLRVGTFTPEQGAWPPPEGTMLVERAALGVLGPGGRVGQDVTVQLPNGEARVLGVSGTVHDSGQAPGWMDGVAYGYVTPRTLAGLRGTGGVNELKLRVSGDAADKGRLERIAQDTAVWLEAQGRSVLRIDIPPSAEHPHQAQMNALLVLLLVFSVLALLLSGVLVANLITALLAQQVRQIGVMKAVGARTAQVAGVYLVTVLVLCGLALALALPSGLLAARYAAGLAAGLLNFNIVRYTVPTWVFGVQVLAGLAVPLLVAAFPIWRGTRVTVREALSDYGVPQAVSEGTLERLLGRLRGVGLPLLLSLRNTFRRRERLALTLGTLAVGGAMFMAALNVTAAWNATLDQAFETRRWGVEVRLEEPTSAAQLLALADKTPGVARAEAWGYARTARSHEGEVDVTNAYPGGVHGGVVALAPPPGSRLGRPPLVSGHWLRGAPDEAVVNEAFLRAEPDLELGSRVALTLGEGVATYTVVGTVREIGAPGTVYLPSGTLGGRAGALRVVTQDRSAIGQGMVAQRLEQALAGAGIDVAATSTSAQVRGSFDEHITILVTALLTIAGLVVAVGGLGLATTMSVNVLERIREFGVMRATGATSRDVLRLVVVEGVLVGALGALVAFVLSLPLSLLVDTIAGQVGLQAPLVFRVSLGGVLLWFTLAVGLAALASLVPAQGAARLTVRQVLAYE